jgi:hypothetical protein
MTLRQAFQCYSVRGIDPSMLHGQEGAFAKCLSFFADLKKTRAQNRRHSTYGLKHRVERLYHAFVYEGTFILAGLASGFAMEQRGNHMKASFAFSERSLKALSKRAT